MTDQLGTRRHSMMTTIQVVFYPLHGHIHPMAEAAAASAHPEVPLLQVEELAIARFQARHLAEISNRVTAAHWR